MLRVQNPRTKVVLTGSRGRFRSTTEQIRRHNERVMRIAD